MSLGSSHTWFFCTVSAIALSDNWFILLAVHHKKCNVDCIVGSFLASSGVIEFITVFNAWSDCNKATDCITTLSGSDIHISFNISFKALYANKVTLAHSSVNFQSSVFQDFENNFENILFNLYQSGYHSAAAIVA